MAISNYRLNPSYVSRTEHNCEERDLSRYVDCPAVISFDSESMVVRLVLCAGRAHPFTGEKEVMDYNDLHNIRDERLRR